MSKALHTFRIESGDESDLERLDRVAKDNNVAFSAKHGWVTDYKRKAGIFAFALVGLNFKFTYECVEVDHD